MNIPKDVVDRWRKDKDDTQQQIDWMNSTHVRMQERIGDGPLTDVTEKHKAHLQRIVDMYATMIAAADK